MSKIRINDLARELEVKSKAILDVLQAVGVTEKKTHSSSIEVDEAERVRKHILGQQTPTSAKEPASFRELATPRSTWLGSSTSPCTPSTRPPVWLSAVAR